MTEDSTLIVLAETIKTLREYREAVDRLLHRQSRYVLVGDRQQLTALNRKVEYMEKALQSFEATKQ